MSLVSQMSQIGDAATAIYVADGMNLATCYLRDFGQKKIRNRDRRVSGKKTVQEALERLTNNPVPRPGGNAPTLEISGVFTRSALFQTAWWSQVHKHSLRESEGRDGLQRWLEIGLFDWGPSWDIPDKTGNVIWGQLGHRDESYSLPVVIVGEAAERIGPWLDEQIKKNLAFSCKINGILCNRTHLEGYDQGIYRSAESWGAQFNHCLILSEEKHDIVPSKAATDYYGSYLWQCWCRSGSFNHCKPEQVRMADSYFIWEDTDLTNRDSIEFGIDSLQHKADHLRKRYGELRLLQNSAAPLPGKPLLLPKEFHSFVKRSNRIYSLATST